VQKDLEEASGTWGLLSIQQALPLCRVTHFPAMRKSNRHVTRHHLLYGHWLLWGADLRRWRCWMKTCVPQVTESPLLPSRCFLRQSMLHAWSANSSSLMWEPHVVLEDLHTISNAINTGMHKGIFWSLILFLQVQNHIRKRWDAN
jgi:hypothetical protein